MKNLLPRRWPYWAWGSHTDGPVFDIWWLGFFQVVRDRTKRYYRHGWKAIWNDD